MLFKFLILCPCMLTPSVPSVLGFSGFLWRSSVPKKSLYQRQCKNCCYICFATAPIPQESSGSLLMPELPRKSRLNWMKVNQDCSCSFRTRCTESCIKLYWYGLGSLFILAAVVIGSITSRCSGNEPALLPRRFFSGRDADDTRGRRKSSRHLLRFFFSLASPGPSPQEARKAAKL